MLYFTPLWLSMQSQFCLCFVTSAFDLQYVILHKGLVPPSTFGEGVIMCFPGEILVFLPSLWINSEISVLITVILATWNNSLDYYILNATRQTTLFVLGEFTPTHIWNKLEKAPTIALPSPLLLLVSPSPSPLLRPHHLYVLGNINFFTQDCLRIHQQQLCFPVPPFQIEPCKWVNFSLQMFIQDGMFKNF